MSPRADPVHRSATRGTARTLRASRQRVSGYAMWSSRRHERTLRVLDAAMNGRQPLSPWRDALAFWRARRYRWTPRRFHTCVVRDGVAPSCRADREMTWMEVAPGVFVTATSTDEWQPHADPAGELHVLCRGVGLNAGLWRSVPGTTPQQLPPWTAPSREAKIVLAGTARVEIKDGPTLS